MTGRTLIPPRMIGREMMSSIGSKGSMSGTRGSRTSWVNGDVRLTDDWLECSMRLADGTSNRIHRVPLAHLRRRRKA